MKHLVKIFDAKYIPGVGRGPFVNPPALITETTYRNLISMGIHCVKVENEEVELTSLVDDETIINTDDVNNEVEDETTVDPEGTEVEDETTVDPEGTEVEDETTVDPEETEVEDEATVDPEGTEVDEPAYTIDYENCTIKDLKAILDEIGVEYESSALKKELIDLCKENGVEQA